jgi:hypothetical protein
MLPGCLVSRHRWAACLHHEPGAVEVGVNDRVPALDRKVDGGLRKLAPRAVDENVQATVRRPYGLDQFVALLWLPDVHSMSACLETARFERRGQRIELVLVSASDDDMRAEASEQPRRRTANAPGPATHERDHSVERAGRIDGLASRKRLVVEPEAQRLSPDALIHRSSCPEEARLI